MLQETEVTQNDIDRALQAIQQKGISSSTKPVLQVNIDRIQKAQNGGFPQDMFHATLAPRQAMNEAQEQMLMSQGYKREYIHCTHPKWMHRRNMSAAYDPAKNPDRFDPLKNPMGVGNPFVESRQVGSPEAERKLVTGKNERDCGPWVASVDLIAPMADTPGAEDMRTQLAYSEGQVDELRRQVVSSQSSKEVASPQSSVVSSGDPKRQQKHAAPGKDTAEPVEIKP